MLVKDIIDRTFNEWLYPAGIDRPAFDVLDANIDEDDLTITLRGRLQKVPRDSLLEIGSELILTDEVSGSTVTAFERGYLDTDATTHDAGSRVLLDPKFTRKSVLDSVVTLVRSLYPLGLYWKGVDTTTTYDWQGLKELPTGGRRVLSILVDRSLSFTRYRELIPGQDYKTYEQFSPTKYQLFRGGAQGAAMVVTFAKDFGEIEDEDTDLDDVGVPSACQSYLPLGVAGNLLISREVPRSVVDEVRRMLATQGIQVGATMNVGGAMLRQFERYVEAERIRMRDEDQTKIEWVRP